MRDISSKQAGKGGLINWITTADFIITVSEYVGIPDTPIFIWGKPNSQDLANVLKSNPYSEELFSSGVLFVANVYEKNNLNGYVQSISIEGVGATALKAKLNFLAGADQDTVEELSDAAKDFFEKTYPLDGLTRVKDKDIGFFLKRDGNGDWIFPQENDLKIDMSVLRERAQKRHFSLLQVEALGGKSELSKIVRQQMAHEVLLDEYSGALRRKGYHAKIAEIVELQRSALKDLDIAAKEFRKAAKWARVAQGIAVISSLISIAGTAAGEYSSQQSTNANSEATGMAANAIADVGFKETALEVKLQRYNENIGVLSGFFRNGVPNLAVPLRKFKVEKFIEQQRPVYLDGNR